MKLQKALLSCFQGELRGQLGNCSWEPSTTFHNQKGGTPSTPNSSTLPIAIAPTVPAVGGFVPLLLLHASPWQLPIASRKGVRCTHPMPWCQGRPNSSDCEIHTADDSIGQEAIHSALECVVSKFALMAYKPMNRGFSPWAITPSGWLLCSNLIAYTFATSNHLPQKRHVGSKRKNQHKKRNHSYQKRSPMTSKIKIFWDHLDLKKIHHYLPWQKNRHLFRDDFPICSVGNLGSTLRPHCAFSAKGSQAELHKDQGNSEVPSLPHLRRGRQTTNKKQIPFSNISNPQYTFCLHSGCINKQKYLLGEFGESYYSISLEEFQKNQPSFGG